MLTQYIFCQLLTDPLVILPAPLRLTRLFILGISHFFGDLGVVFYKTFLMKCQEQIDMPETKAPDSGSKNPSGSLHVLHHRLLATSLSCFNKNYFHSSEHGTKKVQLNFITRGFGKGYRRTKLTSTTVDLTNNSLSFESKIREMRWWYS